ncbi:hypothetical protein DJ71_21890 [Halorubrum sp. E3]|uniref:DUF502 domain-containing protein n=1 Tax=Halorubrum persicum TaxID=1383844 RepID=A0A2G1WG43_9EURY|nr:DUF502 domain-containing protein [Halorubrum persicum]OYR66767.1 hypothetical protein DJ71_21890 [Halorubrum sp. E3]PHQ37951.1 hypothetical protein DJ69_14270 [Halorubrum persicum]
MIDPSPAGRKRLRRAFLTGVAVIVPSVITLVVLSVVFNAIYNYLDAFSSTIVPVLPPATLPISREVAIEIATPIVFVASILVLGILVESTRYGELAVEYAHYGIEQIPGVGSVYQGFRQMSDAMLESDTGNFRDVVLVEFPTGGSYTLAFVTSETPASIADRADGGEMRSLFMPMAPNPVMGGHVVFVPEHRIVDVDLTVDEGIRAIVTSGVALSGEGADADAGGLSPEELKRIGAQNRIGSEFRSEYDTQTGTETRTDTGTDTETETETDTGTEAEHSSRDGGNES